MKLQHLAVIFVIIILPISLVLAAYLGNQITTIQLQTQYSTKLINATYDSLKAFKINTANNNYSTLGASKARDIEASVSTFYRTLATAMGTIGYSSYELQTYTPALVYTLHDGFYIYTKYYDTNKNEYTYGLKPMIAYSCRYKVGNGDRYDFVVNYTLDNSISIIGTVDGEFVTKSGYLITRGYNVHQYEALYENLITFNDAGNPENTDSDGKPVPVRYQYIVYNNQKVYKDGDRYFYYSSGYRKDYLKSSDDIREVESRFNNGGSNSASMYYTEAATFSYWVMNKLSSIKISDAVDANGNSISFASNLSGNVFDVSTDNDPLVSTSLFNEHRMNVIRRTIETNLASSIANYNSYSKSGYQFTMPILNENEWDKIENNVCMIAFLQGLPIGGKLYNNYCVVANNANKETIGRNSIYIIDSEGEYHKPGCATLIAKLRSGTATIVGAYANSDFERKAVSLTGEDANAGSQLTGSNANDTAYYFPQAYTSCYDCIVNSQEDYDIDDIINGKVNIPVLKDAYLKALARCRYDAYTQNQYFSD